MKFTHLFALVVALLALASCDDDTATLGVDMMPTSDLVTKNYKTYDVTTESYAVGDSVLARTTKSYFGRFTDPETGTTIKSDFLAQFHCDEGFELPDSIRGDSCVQFELRLYIEDFVGDSLTSFKLSVYELNEQLDPNADYYTNIDPKKYYDENAQPIASKWFTISDRTITDSARWSTRYNNNIHVSLPNSLGNQIIQDYRKHPEHFASTSTWLKSGNPCSKGLYFKLESGDGAMAYIDIIQMNMYFYAYVPEYGKDTLGVSSFAATDAVVEATHFENSNLQKLLDDKYATYLKSPAGIFTLATIPADQINVQDTINSAKLTLTRYNDLIQSSFKLDIPKTILLVRLDDYLNGFFENYKVNDSKESYLATFDSSKNSYVFSNIARLITRMAKEKKEGKASENWNKVLLIPVESTKDSSGNIVKLNHDFSMSSAKLVGGKDDKISLEVIYTSFHY
ncbi:MAG: DUF4270 domain-containing protein [Bacteroidaceae bacterium]|nr:DUF4270 domain-containing protein [Bacteroidaceae bacterium]